MAADITDYRDIFLNDRPMMDTRAPVEFAKGAFPGVVNLPLMNDDERQRVGTCYKQQGQQAAIVLGHRTGLAAIKAERIEHWARLRPGQPGRLPVLLSWRTALADRPAMAQDRGGHRLPACRSVATRPCAPSCLRPLEQAVAAVRFRVARRHDRHRQDRGAPPLRNALDLEGHANHRGSSFGKRATGQPAQIDFENRLAIDLLKKRAAGHRAVRARGRRAA